MYKSLWVCGVVGKGFGRRGVGGWDGEGMGGWVGVRAKRDAKMCPQVVLRGCRGGGWVGERSPKMSRRWLHVHTFWAGVVWGGVGETTVCGFWWLVWCVCDAALGVGLWAGKEEDKGSLEAPTTTTTCRHMARQRKGLLPVSWGVVVGGCGDGWPLRVTFRWGHGGPCF